MAYDPAIGKTILYGGSNQSSAVYSDTWSWNGTTWTQLTPSSGPGPLYDASMVYDPAISKLVLFGGEATFNTQSSVSSATWTFNGTTWTQLSPATSPSARDGQSMAYDSLNGNLVLFGGLTSSGSYLGDTWIFNGTTWSEQSPANSPTPRFGASMAYDSTLHRVILYAGCDDTGQFNHDMYSWDPGTDTWVAMYNDITAPVSMNQAMAPSATNGQLLLVGGFVYAAPYVSSQTQLLDWGKRGVDNGDQDYTLNLGDQTSLSVDLGSGNLYVSQNLISLAGTGIDFDESAYYDSEDWNWGFAQDSSDATLSLMADGSAVISGIDGTEDELWFPSTGTNTFGTPPGVAGTLTYSSTTNEYTMSYGGSETEWVFAAPSADGTTAGAIVAMTDTSGDTISVDEGTSVTDTRGRTSYENWSSGWNWETPDGRTWDQNVSSSTGEETQIEDPTGATTVYGYDSAGDHMLEQITDPDGHVVDIGYNANGQVDSITQVIASGNGPTTTFAWQAAPTGVSVPSGTTAQYEVVETDPDGHVTTLVDQYGGQTIATINPAGANSTATYNSANLGVSTATNALGNTSTNSYSSTTPADQTAATAAPTASGQNAASDTATFNTSNTISNFLFLPSSTTDAEGNCTAYVYDTSGKVTDTYSGQSSPCDGHTGGIHTESRYQGDPGVTSCGGKTGEVCETVNGNGYATTFGYDSLGEETSVTPPSALHSTTYTYDSDSRIATITDGTGTRTYSYDGDNRLNQVLYGGATTCTPSTGNCITYTYDGDGNETATADNTGTTTGEYDQLGRLIKETPSDGTTNTCSSPNDAGIVYSYDDASDLIGECTGNGTTGYAYDSEGDLLATGTPITQVGLSQASGSGLTSVSLILPAELQANDQIILAVTVPSTISVTTPSGYTLVGSHSSSGVREVIFSRTAVSGDTTVTVSVSASTTVTAIAGVYRGVSTTTPVEATNSNGTTGTTVTISGVTTTGDSDKLLLAVGSVGTYSAGTGFNTPTNMYNDQAVTGLANRSAGLFSQTLTASGATGSRTFTFPTSSGLEGILIALTPSNTTTAPTTYTYDAVGDRLTTSYPDGVTQTSTYNGAGELATINAAHGSTTLANYTYTWANGANDKDLRQSVTESVAGQTYGYTYDAWDRLTRSQETSGGSNNYQYTYDNDGNILTQNLNGTTTTATYNAADETCWAYVGTTTNACGSAPTGAVTNTYDSTGNGNLTGTSAGFSASYNSKNQTANITPTGGSATALTYAGQGQTDRTASGSTSFINDPLGIVSSTISGATTNFTTEPDGQLTSISTGGTTYYYLYDGVSNVIGLVNSSGSRVATYTYDPYGNTTGTGTAASLNPYRYEGGYQDTTGLYHFGERYYSSVAGQFTQLDPTDVDPGYSYAEEDPINDSDPTGTSGNPAGCTVVTTKVYLRKSYNFGSVGFKPTVSCDVIVSSLQLTANLYKYHFFGLLSETVGPTFTNGNTSAKSLTNLNVAVTCLNAKSTTWYAVASATAVYLGVTYTGTYVSPDATLDCGT